MYSKQNDAQAQGSGITYARRYGLQSLVNVGAEDDDGNSASKQKEETKEEPKKNAFGISKNFGKEMDEDMKDTQRKKNEEEFDTIKLSIMQLGSVSELKAAWESRMKEIRGLGKYAPDLFAELEAIKDREKKRILEEQKKDNQKKGLLFNVDFRR
jgi:hypothetical protein